MENVYETNFWKKRIESLTKKKDIDGLEKYKQVISATSGVDDSVKADYIAKCDEAINEVNDKASRNERAKSVRKILGDKEIDSSNVTVGENTKHFKINKTVAAVATVVALSAAIVGVGYLATGCGTDKGNKQNTESENDLNNIGEASEQLDERLAFDSENTEVMKNNISNFFKDSLGKGLYLSEETLTHDVEAFLDFYVALNIDEIGPGYLAELYQDDKKSYLDIFNNYVRWAMDTTDTAMMSTKDNVINISSIISNKVEGEMVQKTINLLAEMHDNGLAGNKDALKVNASDFQAILNEVLLDEKSASYSTASKIMVAYAAMNADTLLINYKDIKVVNDDIRKIMYEDAEIGCAMTIRDYRSTGKTLSMEDLMLLLNASEKNQSAVEFSLQIEKKIDQMVLILNTTDKDYSNLPSADDVIIDLVRTIDLSSYKAVQSLKEYNDITHEINFPTIKVPENATIVDGGNSYVEKEEMDKHNATNEEEYKESVKEETEEKLEDEKVVIDSEGNVSTGDEADKAEIEAYKKAAYMTGYSDGIQGKPYNATPGYETYYNEGYAEGMLELEESKKQNAGVVEETTETFVEPIVEATEVIGSGLVPDEKLEPLPEETSESSLETYGISEDVLADLLGLNSYNGQNNTEAKQYKKTR